MARSLFFWFGALLALALWMSYNRLQDGALGQRIQQWRTALNDHLPFGWGERQPKAERTVLYRWRDAEGIEHLSDSPHPGAERIVVEAPRMVHPPPVASPDHRQNAAAPAALGQSEQPQAGDERPDLFGIRQSLEKKLQDSQDKEDRQIDRDSGH